MIISFRNISYVSLFFLAAFLITAVESIKCYRCSSIDTENSPYQCNEFFEHSELEPESCDDVHNAQYCIKQIGVFEGGLLTKRYCSSAYLGNYCNPVRQPGGRTNYRSCLFTCSGDGCNSAVTVKNKLFSVITLITLFLLYVVY